jgi:ribosomal protein S6
LAYPINKQSDGYYAVFNLVAKGGALDEVERTLKLIQRHRLFTLHRPSGCQPRQPHHRTSVAAAF